MAAGEAAETHSDTVTLRRTGRPRSEAARRAVLDAAYGVLTEAGLAGFSVEAVAARAGVARTTIYRWWPTKGQLAMESFLKAFRPQLAYAETSDVEGDFENLIGSLSRLLSGPAGRIAASIIAHAQSDGETRQAFVEVFSKPLRRESSKILSRGIATGLFRECLDVAVVLDAAIGGVYLRLLLGQSLDPAWSRAFADTVIRGCRADRLGDVVR